MVAQVMAGHIPKAVKASEVKAVAIQDADLTVEEAEVMTEILMEVGEDKVDAKVVMEVSKLAKEASESVSPELVQTLGTLMDPLTTEVDMEEIKVIKVRTIMRRKGIHRNLTISKILYVFGQQEMTEEIKRDPSMTTLNKVSAMLEEKGSDLTMQDIMIVNDIVNVMGPKVRLLL